MNCTRVCRAFDAVGALRHRPRPDRFRACAPDTHREGVEAVRTWFICSIAGWAQHRLKTCASLFNNPVTRVRRFDARAANGGDKTLLEIACEIESAAPWVT